MRRSSGSVRKPLVSVLTPTIPSRSRMLKECEQSVRSQTFGSWEHLIQLDSIGAGCAVTMNKIAVKATGLWLLPLADDDMLLPGCLKTLLSFTKNADIVYAPPLVWGKDAGPFCKTPPEIPSCALVRRSLWEQIGGYQEHLRREEDRNLWTRALNLRARFVRVESAPTWIYRFHDGNKSFNEGKAA